MLSLSTRFKIELLSIMFLFGQRFLPCTAAACAVGVVIPARISQSEGKKEGRFVGKTIMITGGAGTFGTVGAEYFASEGANVCLVDVNKKALDSAIIHLAKKQLSGEMPTAPILALPCDIRDTAAVELAVEEARKRFGEVDLLWNNAGYQGAMQPLLEYDSKDVQLVMDINVSSVALAS